MQRAIKNASTVRERDIQLKSVILYKTEKQMTSLSVTSAGTKVIHSCRIGRKQQQQYPRSYANLTQIGYHQQPRFYAQPKIAVEPQPMFYSQSETIAPPQPMFYAQPRKITQTQPINYHALPREAFPYSARNSNPAQQGYPQQMGNTTIPAADRTTSTIQDNQQTMRCYACGNAGHYSKNCPNKNRVQSFAQQELSRQRCEVCESIYHDRESCPEVAGVNRHVAAKSGNGSGLSMNTVTPVPEH